MLQSRHDKSEKRFTRSAIFWLARHRNSATEGVSLKSPNEMALCVRLRHGEGCSLLLSCEWRINKLRVLKKASHQRCANDTRNVAVQTLGSMDGNAPEMPQRQSFWVQILRGARYQSLRTMARLWRVLGRYGRILPRRPDAGPHQRGWGLRAFKLSMGNPQGAGGEQAPALMAA